MSTSNWRFRLFADTAFRSFQEDPGQLSAQASRRFLPSRARTVIASVAARFPGTRLRNVACALADRPDLAKPGSAQSQRARAREFWNRGDIDAALKLLNPSDGALGSRLTDEWAMIADGHALRIPAPEANFPRKEAANLTLPGLDVLHVLTNSLPYTQSGYTVRSHRLLGAQKAAGVRLQAATRVGYPVVIGNLAVPDYSVIDDVTYHRLLPPTLERMPRARVAQHASLLADLAARLGPSVLHTTTDYRNGLAVEAAAHALGLPWVYEMRGQLEKSWVARQKPEYREAAEASERFLAWRATETRLATSADAVVVLSEVQREELVARGVDGEKIRIMPNAFDWPGDVERVSRPEARGLLGLPEADVWIGSVSAVVDYEGFDTLIRAVALVRERGIDARAAIVGDGVAKPGLEALARELGISEFVEFPGRVPISESHTWYQALDLFAVPRTDTPVCRIITPIKPLEALACSTPVLVSDLPALQLAPSHGAGLAIEPGSPEKWAKAIHASMPGSGTYIRMADAASVLAPTQSWSANARISIDMYGEIA